MSFRLTWGWDRALGKTVPDGPLGTLSSGPIGTAAPPGALIITTASGYTSYAEELPESPTVERGQQATARHAFRMPYANAVAMHIEIGMGTMIQDGGGNLWRVVTSTTESMEGEWGIFSTVSESVSFDSPPDEFQVVPSDMGIDIIKHPRYFPNLYPTAAELGTYVGQIKESIIRGIQTYRDSPFFPTANNVTSFINGFVQDKMVAGLKTGKIVIAYPNPNFTPQFDYKADTDIQYLNTGLTFPPVATANGQKNDHFIPVGVDTNTYQFASVQLAMAAASEIITKLWRMEDSPYIPSIMLRWTSYFFLPTFVNLGSYLEDPMLIIPDYFTNPEHPISELPPRSGLTYPFAGPHNLFALNAQNNPQDYSSTGDLRGQTNMSCLRQADEVNWQRGLCGLTRSWICSVIGTFDPQIYGATVRPTRPSDYVTFS